MKESYFIGCMTGNSMDAIDLVLTAFCGDKMRDVAGYSVPYSADMQTKMATLRAQAYGKNRAQIEALDDFYAIHDEYVQQVANAVEVLCRKAGIRKEEIAAIGFHGKTLDHNPPSKAEKEKTQPYTVQLGSGKMLADLTGIRVVYDFRSAYIMAGFEGAPLVPLHNAHIAATEGDGIYYNGGNTANFAVIKQGKPVLAADVGPFNNYIDTYIRQQTSLAFDEDGKFGQKGCLQAELFARLFEIGREFYEKPFPKSGDPAYYHQDEIFSFVREKQIDFCDAVRTFEYFSAYVTAFALAQAQQNVTLPSEIILFGGGWKNPVVLESFERILSGKGTLLPEHQRLFADFLKQYPLFHIRYSSLGTYMEARLFADMARYRLAERPWILPETENIIAGEIAQPQSTRNVYDDYLNKAVKGWQK